MHTIQIFKSKYTITIKIYIASHIYNIFIHQLANNSYTLYYLLTDLRGI